MPADVSGSGAWRVRCTVRLMVTACCPEAQNNQPKSDPRRTGVASRISRPYHLVKITLASSETSTVLDIHIPSVLAALFKVLEAHLRIKS